MSGRDTSDDETAANPTGRPSYVPDEASRARYSDEIVIQHLTARWAARRAGSIVRCGSCAARLLLAVSDVHQYQWICAGCGVDSEWFAVVGGKVLLPP